LKGQRDRQTDMTAQSKQIYIKRTRQSEGEKEKERHTDYSNR